VPAVQENSANTNSESPSVAQDVESQYPSFRMQGYDAATGEEAFRQRSMMMNSGPTASAPPSVPHVYDNASGEEAFQRRAQLSSNPVPPPPPSIEEDMAIPPPPPPPPPTEPPQVPTKMDARSILLSAASISKPAIRYELPEAPLELQKTDEEVSAMFSAAEESSTNTGDVPMADANAPQQSSNLPGQQGFAKRFMEKYGWSKGSGLGATGSGIITPLIMKAEKRKNSDTEGGGFADRSGMGRIVGGKRAKGNHEEQGGKFGQMSQVVVLRDMLKGMDVRRAIEEENLYQEIGGECDKKVCSTIYQPAE
jgi:splicing factor 45